MSQTTKFVYFIVAVVAMVCLALASVAMASNRGSTAVLLFVIAFAIIAAAFVTKAKIRAKQKQS